MRLACGKSAKRPTTRTSCEDEVNYASQQQHKGAIEQCSRPGRGEQEQPPAQSNQQRQWIEPDAKRSLQVRPIGTQPEQGADLPDELNDDSRGQQRVDHGQQGKQSADDRHKAHK